MSADTVFSNNLLSCFDGFTARETLQWMCDERLGHGMSREVFRFAPDRDFVIKFELVEGHFQNVKEMETWRQVEHTESARWFAPCHSISGNGRVLLQRYARPISVSELPTEVPRFFTDLKPGNWGFYGKQPVAVDYGLNLLMGRGITKALKKAQW